MTREKIVITKESEDSIYYSRKYILEELSNKELSELLRDRDSFNSDQQMYIVGEALARVLLTTEKLKIKR